LELKRITIEFTKPEEAITWIEFSHYISNALLRKICIHFIDINYIKLNCWFSLKKKIESILIELFDTLLSFLTVLL